MEGFGDIMFLILPKEVSPRRMYSAHSPSVTHEDLKKEKPHQSAEEGHSTHLHALYVYTSTEFLSTCLSHG